MCGGGGGGTPAMQDNSLQIENMRQQAARDSQTQAAADEQRKQDQFNSEIGSAVSNARNTGMNYLGARGLSTDQYGSVIDQIINDTRAKVPNLDPNAPSYFTSDTFASGLDNYQNIKRGNNNAKVTGTFTPGYDKTYIPDSADDQIINEILGTQTGTAQQNIDFQKKRGLLNDSGYATAEQRLGDQGQAARSTLSSLGTGVLNKDRANLTDIVANAGNAANQWTLGAPEFSVDPYKTQVGEAAKGSLDNLGGDIKAALGSTQLFDIPSIIAAAGTAQGPQNLTTADATSGIPQNRKNPNVNRGLGSTGVFLAMFGIDDVALAGLAGSAISGGLSLMGQGKQQSNADAQLQLAMQAYQAQKQQADREYELATAGRTDARGNQTTYVPGRGWVTTTTPQTRGLINSSDALQMATNRNQLTRGEDDRSRNFNRRLTEGSTADPMLQAIKNGYGAPTRAGVGGRNAVSNVTQAAESADNIRGGYAGAALRTGQGTVPLALNMQSIDKGGTAGIRSALARSDTETDPLFQSISSQFMNNKLNPYNTLATRAGNSGDVPFQPENLSTGIDASTSGAAQAGALRRGTASDALYRGVAPVLSAYGAQRTPDYDLFSAGVTSNIKELLRGYKPQDAMSNRLSAANKDWSTSSLNDSAFNSWRF